MLSLSCPYVVPMLSSSLPKYWFLGVFSVVTFVATLSGLVPGLSSACYLFVTCLLPVCYLFCYPFFLFYLQLLSVCYPFAVYLLSVCYPFAVYLLSLWLSVCLKFFASLLSICRYFIFLCSGIVPGLSSICPLDVVYFVVYSVRYLTSLYSIWYSFVIDLL